MSILVKNLIDDFDGSATIYNYFGFCDWFCREITLRKRAEKQINIILYLVDCGIIDPNKIKISFKNSKPGFGNLYDMILFHNLDGEYIGGFCSRTGHHKAELRTELWYFNTDENGGLSLQNMQFENYRAFKKAVKNNTDNINEKIQELFN